MTEKTHAVPNGVIHYWMNNFQPGRAVLVFLPGLTADHRLFDKQVEAFESTYNLLAWDAPGHGKSRPFVMDFTLAQKAAWLHAILQAEGITAPVLVAIVIGGDLLGVVGMVVGVPTFATFYGLLRQFTAWCLERRGIDAEGNPRAKQAEPVQPLNENQVQPRNETENQPAAVQH